MSLITKLSLHFVAFLELLHLSASPLLIALFLLSIPVPLFRRKGEGVVKMPLLLSDSGLPLHALVMASEAYVINTQTHTHTKCKWAQIQLLSHDHTGNQGLTHSHTYAQAAC